MLKFSDSLIEGIFLERKNRFAATIEVQGLKELVHVPNSGRMRELLIPGTRVWLAPAAGRDRKTAFDLILAEYNGLLVSVDSRMANNLLDHWLKGESIPELRGFNHIKREVAFGHSRFDFFLAGETGGCFIEAKSVTLVEDERARFPDAPTERGARHLRELVNAVEQGLRSVIFFVIQREDAASFTPNDVTDPVFGMALREAAAQGVEVYAYTSVISREGITLGNKIPVIM